MAIEIVFEHLPVHDGFYAALRKGVSTGSTDCNQENTTGFFEDRAGLDRERLEVLFDPQTSGGLLLSVAPEKTAALLEALIASGHRAAHIGRVVDSPVAVRVL